jgi:hypothetical protein
VLCLSPANNSLAHSIDVTVRLGTILNKSGLADYLANYSGNDGCITLLAAIISAVGGYCFHCLCHSFQAHRNTL